MCVCVCVCVCLCVCVCVCKEPLSLVCIRSHVIAILQIVISHIRLHVAHKFCFLKLPSCKWKC